MEFVEADYARPEPLDFETWVKAIRRTQSGLPQEPDEIAISRALRRAFHLAQLTPAPFKPIFAPACAEDRYESLLDESNLESAAQALLTPMLEVEVSKPDGKFIAIVRTAGAAGIGTGISSHPAAALLQAWFGCISSAVAMEVEPDAVLNQDRHISPRGSHPSLRQH